MCTRICALLWYQPDPPEDAKDVRVQREDFFAAGEEQRTGDGFGPNAAKLREIANGLFSRDVMKEREVERAALLFDLTKQASYHRSLLIGEPARLDRGSDSRLACTQHTVPCREATLERPEGTMTVGIARRLREDYFDEHVERVGGALVVRYPVNPFEILDNVPDRLFF